MKKIKKIGIVTIIDNKNCGNRLQNYALQEILKIYCDDVQTIKNEFFLNWNDKYAIGILRYIYKQLKHLGNKNKFFDEFNKKISFSNKLLTVKSRNISSDYDYFVVGSDQVWKPTRRRLSKVDLLSFAEPQKRISYAASFGLEKIDESYYEILKEELPKFKAISVREIAGANIIENATGLKNVELVLDPTLLLDKHKWSLIEKRPKKNNARIYVFTYFLGNEDTLNLAKKIFGNKFDIVDFKNDDYGPSEFLYLINHAEYILTDSFHGTVFSIIFEKEFWVFNRKQNDTNNNMNSRLDTLLGKLSLNDRKVDDLKKIDKKKKIDYSSVEKKLEYERKVSIDFLNSALK